MITFDSKLRVHPTFKLRNHTQDVVKNEPMLFNCDIEAAEKLGGPITHDFIDILLALCLSEQIDPYSIVIDSRVHMLMPGWAPAILGWHHDDIPRTRPDGQPNYHNQDYQAKHCLAIVNAEIAPTHFATGNISLPDIEEGEKYYKKWHPLVENAIGKELQLEVAESRKLYLFDCFTFHKAILAVKNGWRFFIRASWNTKRKPTNELRRQVNVYVPHPFEGW